MRLAFWRTGNDKARGQRAVSKPAPAIDKSTGAPLPGDVDLQTLGQALMRNRDWIIVPTVLAAVLSIAAVNLVSPRYKSEARILIDGRENVSPQPNAERNEEPTALDSEAVTSQVQLLLSRNLAPEIIKRNRLAELPEFDPVLQGLSPLKSMLAMFGIGRDPLSLTPEERVLDAYFERFAAYAVDKSPVIVIEFQSRDPELAARVANSIAEGYLVSPQNARLEQTRSASLRLSNELENLHTKVAEAESRVEDFRSKSSLFVGNNNTALPNLQIGELNAQLNNARALKSDAETKARLIHEMLQSGKPIEASEVLNSELSRRLSEQRITLRAQLAGQSSTLLDGHPRIKELKAQLADLDRQLREEASKISRSLDNDVRNAGGRVEDLSASLEQLKKQLTSTNGQDVQLRALEREAKAQRDLLQSYLAKYREVNTREDIGAAPAHGRIISHATVSDTPAYPKKLPIVLIVTLATLMLSAGAIASGEWLRMTAPRAAAAFASSQAPAPVPPPSVATVAVAAPVFDETRTEVAHGLTEIEQLAEKLHGAGEAARKVTILGTAAGESITLTALTLARLIAHHAKVVVVDLSASSPVISAVSVDPAAPGLAELMLGQASFSQVITKDRLSRVHLVSAGRPGSDRALLQSPRLTLAIDALLRVYDHVLLDAGTATDLSAELLTAQARAVVVPDASMADDARDLMCDQLKAVGFTEVTMLNKPSEPSNAIEPGPRMAAA
jgi:succinoglycan biosynthesis transport protein ExoP